MPRKIKILLLLVVFLFCFSSILYPQSRSYRHLLEMGKWELKDDNYEKALPYFQIALLMDPKSKEALSYINLIKRALEGRVVRDETYDKEEIASSTESILGGKSKKKEKQRGVISDTLTSWEKKIAIEKNNQDKIIVSAPLYLKTTQEIKKEKEIKKIKKIEKVKRKVVPGKKKTAKKEEIIYLTSETRDEFPLNIKIAPGGSFKIDSETLKRFLIVSPGVIEVAKLTTNTLGVTATSLGSSFLHVWDNVGRWTFNIKIIPPRVVVKTEQLWEKPDGFKFMYSADWSQYYRGDKFADMKRETLTFDEGAAIVGPTPYGELDASVNWSRLNDQEEVTGYTVGLNKGRFLNFKDFYIRGFDFRETFSSLSFPGETLEGVVFRSPAFHEKIEYTVLYGQQKQYSSGIISPGVIEEEDAYIEGLRLSLFPHNNHKFFFNYAHGFGEDREDYLKDEVFSIQSEHNFGNLDIITEIASDKDSVGANFSSKIQLPKLTLNLSFRNIEKDFVTISGRPPNTGEIGAIAGLDWNPNNKVSLNSSLDVYRDREFFNPKNEDKPNFNWNNYLNIRLSPTSNLATSLYYINSPGLLSPQRSLNTTTTYNKRFNCNLFGDRSVNTFLGYNYQRSINPLSPSSNYRRDSILSGLRLQLAGNLHYYLNYNFSWVDELSTGEESRPSVTETGLDFYHTFNPNLSSSLRLSYRDEENSAALHSFLSGEDSLEGSLNLTYSPKKGTEFFLDGRIRNVWAENIGTEEFIETEIRLGARLSWDNFFSWSPETIIEGFVFKDSNGNGEKDDDEIGIPGIEIIAGPKKVTSAKSGKFTTTVKAKRIIANINFNSAPKGYILTTPASFDLDTSTGERHSINFGITLQSGIYGVVFYDSNGNNKLDKKDITISGVKIILDQKKKTVTNSEGVYFFSGIPTGPHNITFDVNSMPLEYLPKVSIKKEVNVSEGLTYTYHIPLQKK